MITIIYRGKAIASLGDKAVASHVITQGEILVIGDASFVVVDVVKYLSLNKGFNQHSSIDRVEIRVEPTRRG